MNTIKDSTPRATYYQNLLDIVLKLPVNRNLTQDEFDSAAMAIENIGRAMYSDKNNRGEKRVSIGLIRIITVGATQPRKMQ